MKSMTADFFVYLLSRSTLKMWKEEERLKGWAEVNTETIDWKSEDPKLAKAIMTSANEISLPAFSSRQLVLDPSKIIEFQLYEEQKVMQRNILFIFPTLECIAMYQKNIKTSFITLGPAIV